MIRDVPSLSTYPWRASVQSGSLEKFSLNKQMKKTKIMKPNKTKFRLLCSNSKGCVQKKENDTTTATRYLCVSTNHTEEGVRESGQNLSILQRNKILILVISDSPTMT